MMCFTVGLIAQPVLGLTVKVSGLSSPVDVVNAGDNSHRLFVVDQGGVIKAYDQSFNFLGDFLTMTGISTGGERGLLSVAFHPDYATNGFFFVYYTNAAGDVEIARYHTPSATPNAADPTSKQVLLTIPHPTNNNHNGGKLNFGADGYLYFATGDGGGAGDVNNNAQTGTVLLGKMMRINVTTSATAPFYTIPPDNPFLVPGDNINDEIWALGLRNPFRWSFDALTHDMWIGDVGQDAWEEVDFRQAGNTGGINYGWHCMEGTHTYNGCTISGTYAPPLMDYPHINATGGFAIIGGYVYRGTASPAMYGYYIFGDEVSGNVWLLPSTGTASDTIQFTNVLAGLSSFGQDENNELYALSVTNGLLYSVSATGTNALPVTLLNLVANNRIGYNEISWTVGTEQRLDRYTVEYSTDGIHFDAAGTVAANGSNTYSFRHTINVTGTLYYRLKMTDADGSFTYSKLIAINNNTANNVQLVAPTVIRNRILNMNLPQGYKQMELVNMDGRILYHQSIANRSGAFSVFLTGIASGQYLVRIYNSDKQLTQRIIVQ